MKYFVIVYNYIFNRKNLIRLRFNKGLKPKFNQILLFPMIDYTNQTKWKYITHGWMVKLNQK